MSVTATIDLRIRSEQTAPADYEGRATVDTGATGQRLGSGTGASSVDRQFHDIRALGAGANEDLDLKTITDAYGTALALVEVRVFRVYADSDNDGVIEVKPSVADGWAGTNALLKDASDIITVRPGCEVVLLAPADGAYLVGAATKSLNVSHTGALAGSYTITVLGTSA